jgi:prolyl-tRNA editing enzyme YbaK/EbsC (Cys-tRNA(Pro) deacylase)
MKDTDYPEGFQRVRTALAELGHPHEPLWLEVPARTSAEAAQALGVTVAQIAKSVVFRRIGDGTGNASEVRGADAGIEAAVLVVTSGDRRVDEKRVAALTGRLGRADAEFVKARTGFSIGGVAPVAHSQAVQVLIDRELFRFEEIWAAAGHPNGVFKLAPSDLPRLTGGAPVVDVVLQT